MWHRGGLLFLLRVKERKSSGSLNGQVSRGLLLWTLDVRAQELRVEPSGSALVLTRTAWLAGLHAVFPAGTYWLHRFAGVTVAPLPAA